MLTLGLAWALPLHRAPSAPVQQESFTVLFFVSCWVLFVAFFPQSNL
jgi:hypothetical protein